MTLGMAAMGVFLLLMNQDLADDRRAGRSRQKREVRSGPPVAVAFEQQMERIPLLHRMQHAQIDADPLRVREPFEEGKCRLSSAQRSAGEDKMRVSSRIDRLHVQAAAEA